MNPEPSNKIINEKLAQFGKAFCIAEYFNDTWAYRIIDTNKYSAKP
jgi:hypothetical protein